MIDLPEAPLYDGVLCCGIVAALGDPKTLVTIEDAPTQDGQIRGGHPQAIVALQARIAAGQRRYWIANVRLCSGAADTLYKGTALCAPCLGVEMTFGGLA